MSSINLTTLQREFVKSIYGFRKIHFMALKCDMCQARLYFYKNPQNYTTKSCGKSALMDEIPRSPDLSLCISTPTPIISTFRPGLNAAGIESSNNLKNCSVIKTGTELALAEVARKEAFVKPLAILRLEVCQ